MAFVLSGLDFLFLFTLALLEVRTLVALKAVLPIHLHLSIHCCVILSQVQSLPHFSLSAAEQHQCISTSECLITVILIQRKQRNVYNTDMFPPDEHFARLSEDSRKQSLNVYQFLIWVNAHIYFCVCLCRMSNPSPPQTA